MEDAYQEDRKGKELAESRKSQVAATDRGKVYFLARSYKNCNTWFIVSKDNTCLHRQTFTKHVKVDYVELSKLN